MAKRRYFKVYGGPDGGSVLGLSSSRFECLPRHGARHLSGVFPYVLVAASDAGFALVPARDEDLRVAFLRASGEHGDRERETLAMEIRRRTLSRSTK
ncbi:hypothetical protein [Sphingomonas sp. BK580]|uniref:hypothetical protein n=1 Tax=Sphingomonas sp. BK580 TaxID=2586972 RepID=UPI00161E3D7D|nr:hypothetical protein [Sphingomonas sp. BK580]MBB3693544.1 hypothetical protein [Sphingomonas sp. BK580]